MPSLASLTTFSGLLVFAGTFCLLWRRPSIGAVLYLIAGAGGVAIFWDRWSARMGDHVRVSALLDPGPPTAAEAAMLISHFPLLAIGLAVLALTLRSRRAERGEAE